MWNVPPKWFHKWHCARLAPAWTNCGLWTVGLSPLMPGIHNAQNWTEPRRSEPIRNEYVGAADCRLSLCLCLPLSRSPSPSQSACGAQLQLQLWLRVESDESKGRGEREGERGSRPEDHVALGLCLPPPVLAVSRSLRRSLVYRRFQDR